MSTVTIIKATKANATNSKSNSKNRVMFCGVLLVSILKVSNGWQVQMRSTEQTNDWQDVDNGLFKSKQEAQENAPYLCEF